MVPIVDELECDDRFRFGTACLFPASASTAADRAAPAGTAGSADRYDSKPNRDAVRDSGGSEGRIFYA